MSFRAFAIGVIYGWRLLVFKCKMIRFRTWNNRWRKNFISQFSIDAWLDKFIKNILAVVGSNWCVCLSFHFFQSTAAIKIILKSLSLNNVVEDDLLLFYNRADRPLFENFTNSLQIKKWAHLLESEFLANRFPQIINLQWLSEFVNNRFKILHAQFSPATFTTDH